MFFSKKKLRGQQCQLGVHVYMQQLTKKKLHMQQQVPNGGEKAATKHAESAQHF